MSGCGEIVHQDFPNGETRYRAICLPHEWSSPVCYYERDAERELKLHRKDRGRG